jgi:hypothetical protein
MSDSHFQRETIARLSDLALAYPQWDAIAITGDSQGILPANWNDWPQHLKLSVPGNHDSAKTFFHLNNWVHATPWFRRCKELVFLGIDTSDLKNPFATLQDQLDPFWEEDIDGVFGFVLLTHQWPLDHELDQVGQLLRKFIHRNHLLILDGHNHPRGTQWEPNASLGGIVCYRSTVISCNPPKGNAHLITWNGNGFDCKDIRGKYEKPKYKITRVAGEIKIGHTNTHKEKSQSKAATEAGQDKWIKHCGIAQRSSQRICNFCGKALPRH